MTRFCWVLYGRKHGNPYGGTWQARRSGRWRDLWTTWREERAGQREFDRWRLRLRRISSPGIVVRVGGARGGGAMTDDGKHDCPYVGCPQRLPRHILACRPHWFRVSQTTRNRVNATWRSGDIGAYLDAREDAVKEMNLESGA